jgi:hypothetical protein
MLEFRDLISGIVKVHREQTGKSSCVRIHDRSCIAESLEKYENSLNFLSIQRRLLSRSVSMGVVVQNVLHVRGLATA